MLGSRETSLATQSTQVKNIRMTGNDAHDRKKRELVQYRDFINYKTKEVEE
jgi:hypothetical protein